MIFIGLLVSMEVGEPVGSQGASLPVEETSILPYDAVLEEGELHKAQPIGSRSIFIIYCIIP